MAENTNDIKKIDGFEEENAEETPATEECAEPEAQQDKKEKKSELKRLRGELEEAKKAAEESKKAADDANDKYLRTLAEYDNFRKRSQKEKEATYSDAQLATIGAFLPVLDNLERGAAAEDASEGVKLICKQMQEILKKMNVEECGKEGDAFDPNFHNAVMHVEDEEHGDGEIVDVLQVGYRFGEKVLRYAMVKVAN